MVTRIRDVEQKSLPQRLKNSWTTCHLRHMRHFRLTCCHFRLRTVFFFPTRLLGDPSQSQPACQPRVCHDVTDHVIARSFAGRRQPPSSMPRRDRLLPRSVCQPRPPLSTPTHPEPLIDRLRGWHPHTVASLATRSTRRRPLTAGHGQAYAVGRQTRHHRRCRRLDRLRDLGTGGGRCVGCRKALSRSSCSSSPR